MKTTTGVTSSRDRDKKGVPVVRYRTVFGLVGSPISSKAAERASMSIRALHRGQDRELTFPPSGSLEVDVIRILLPSRQGNISGLKSYQREINDLSAPLCACVIYSQTSARSSSELTTTRSSSCPSSIRTVPPKQQPFSSAAMYQAES